MRWFVLFPTPENLTMKKSIENDINLEDFLNFLESEEQSARDKSKSKCVEKRV